VGCGALTWGVDRAFTEPAQGAAPDDTDDTDDTDERTRMLLTFAEIQFLVSLCDTDAELPVLDLLDLLDEPSRNEDDIEDAGLASLVARELCREYLDDHGVVQHVELDHEIAEIHAAVQAATTSIRITTVSPERSTFWLLLVGPRRAALTPVGAGVYGAVVVHHDADLRQQVLSLVNSALVDDPAAGVAITRGGRWDAMSFRTNDELGGPDADPAVRWGAIEELVDTVFVNHHPSHG
jgi:hypothetical protein